MLVKLGTVSHLFIGATRRRAVEGEDNRAVPFLRRIMEPKYLRCITCGNLLTDEMISRGICAGHKVKYAIKVSLWEWIKVKMGLLK